MNFVDNFLNQITMYRLVLYYLILLWVVAFIYSIFGIISYDPLFLALSTIFIITICWLTNTIFAKVFSAPTNLESIYISAMILSLIVAPAKTYPDLFFIFWISVWVAASKFIFAINKKHIFNPVGIAAVLTYFTLNNSAIWWVGILPMLPFVLLGLLIIRKVRRSELFMYFFSSAIATIVFLSLFKNSNPITILEKTFLYSPFFFFTFVMLTEPQTTPPTKKLQSIYGFLVGVLFAPQFNLFGFYTTPEMALVIGNIFSYIVSPKEKLLLILKEKIKVGGDIFDFVFDCKQKLNFSAGQYLEWTLPHEMPDTRGNRRYFTLASAPTEPNLRIGVKFYKDSSSFKKTLGSMKVGDKIVGSQLSGEFTLPKDLAEKLVFIAGGIGVTPFRSMVKYLLDKNEKRDIVIMYSNKTQAEIAYQDFFSQAEKQLGIKTIYTLSDLEKIPANWIGQKGSITPEMIAKLIPDFKDRTFYLSGPHGMVNAFENSLEKMGVKNAQIKTDFFPGFA